MRVCTPFLSPHSALGMNHWLDQVHGYFGQYLYGIPAPCNCACWMPRAPRCPTPRSGCTSSASGPGLARSSPARSRPRAPPGLDGIWELPNVPLDPAKVPPLPTGDTLHDNPFGYLAVVGGNGVLHFEIESAGQTNYAWLGIVEANMAYYRGSTNLAVFERQWSASGVASAPIVLGPGTAASSPMAWFISKPAAALPECPSSSKPRPTFSSGSPSRPTPP